MEINEKTIYYAVVMNLSGLHAGLYRLKWDDEAEGFWDKRRDFGLDLKEIKKIAKGGKQQCGLKWLVYETKTEARAVHDALSVYRDHLKELMQVEMTFVEKYFVEEYWHWKFQFWSNDFITADEDQELYDWCMDNLGGNCNWHVRSHGVIIFNPEDAMAFKLTWM